MYYRPMESGGETTRSSFKTAGDCPDFAQSAEQNGTVPFSQAVLKLLLNRKRKQNGSRSLLPTTGTIRGIALFQAHAAKHRAAIVRVTYLFLRAFSAVGSAALRSPCRI